jgi:hypothetical protein
MEQDFTITKLIGEDSNGIITKEEKYKVSFDTSMVKFYEYADSINTIAICDQPWKTSPDGTRSNWVSIEEAIDWFKNRD